MLSLLLALGCATANPLPAPTTSAPPSFLGDVGAPPVAEDPFAWDIQGQPLQAGSTGALTLRLVIPPDHFVYRDRVWVDVVDSAGLSVGELTLPPGERAHDPAGDMPDREQYGRDVFLSLPISASASTDAGLHSVVLDVHHQGCQPGLCYPPTTTRLTALLPVRSAE